MKKEFTPPALATSLLRWFCSEDRVEEIEGDLYEAYHGFISEKGTRFSSIYYWWIVISTCRFYALRPNRGEVNDFRYFFSLLRHNLSVSGRNLLENKVRSLINLVGLALGLACFLGIFWLTQYEVSFDKGLKNRDRIFRVYSEFKGSIEDKNRGISGGVASYIQETITGVDEVVDFIAPTASVFLPDEAGTPIKLEQRHRVIITDSDYFDLIEQYTWLAGSPEKALSKPDQVVLTDDQARQYYESENWSDIIGKELIYWDSIRFSISGIVRRTNQHSDFRFTDFISKASITKGVLRNRFVNERWDNTNSSTQLFVKVKEGTPVTKMQAYLSKVSDHVNEQLTRGWTQHYHLQPLADIHFNTELGIFDWRYPPTHYPTLMILLVVSVCILLMAVFNFINLETAIATQRNKEVIIRKVMGGSKGQIVFRYMVEGLILSFIAALLTTPLILLAIGQYQEFLPGDFELPIHSLGYWSFLLVFALSMGVLSAVYPAWLVANVSNPLGKNVASSLHDKRQSMPRRILIFLQFSFSQCLIFGTMAVFWQVSFMLGKDLGIAKDRVVNFHFPYPTAQEKKEVILTELNALSGIESVVQHHGAAIARGYSMNHIRLDTTDSPILAHRKSGDPGFFNFYGINLLSGEIPKPGRDRKELLVNEILAQRMGLTNEDAVGRQIDYEGEQYLVKGVVQNFQIRSLHHPLEPMFFLCRPEGYAASIRIHASASIKEVVTNIGDVWDHVFPNETLNLTFMDETIKDFYETERRTRKVVSLATSIAIVLSCLGLFGLMTSAVIQRTKEMGIRKALGASLQQIGFLLSKELLILIALAFVVSIPLAHFSIAEWSASFAHRPGINIGFYLFGFLISLTIAGFTVLFKVIQAARKNPIDSLRYE